MAVLGHFQTEQRCRAYADKCVAALDDRVQARFRGTVEETDRLQQQITVLRQDKAILQRACQHLQRELDELKQVVKSLSDEING